MSKHKTLRSINCIFGNHYECNRSKACLCECHQEPVLPIQGIAPANGQVSTTKIPLETIINKIDNPATPKIVTKEGKLTRKGRGKPNTNHKHFETSLSPDLKDTPNTHRLRAAIMHSIGLEKGTRRYVLTIEQLDRVEQAIIDFMVNLAPEIPGMTNRHLGSIHSYRIGVEDYVANIRRGEK